MYVFRPFIRIIFGDTLNENLRFFANVTKTKTKWITHTHTHEMSMCAGCVFFAFDFKIKGFYFSCRSIDDDEVRNSTIFTRIRNENVTSFRLKAIPMLRCRVTYANDLLLSEFRNKNHEFICFNASKWEFRVQWNPKIQASSFFDSTSTLTPKNEENSVHQRKKN